MIERKKIFAACEKRAAERTRDKKVKKKKKEQKIFITPLASLIVDLITLFFLARV